MLCEELSTPHFGAVPVCNPQSFPRRNPFCLGALRSMEGNGTAFPQVLAQDTVNRNHVYFLTRGCECRMVVVRSNDGGVGGVCRWRVAGQSGAVGDWCRDRRSGKRPTENSEVGGAAGQQCGGVSGAAGSPAM